MMNTAESLQREHPNELVVGGRRTELVSDALVDQHHAGRGVRTDANGTYDGGAEQVAVIFQSFALGEAYPHLQGVICPVAAGCVEFRLQPDAERDCGVGVYETGADTVS